jgi:hypothetical protein
MIFSPSTGLFFLSVIFSLMACQTDKTAQKPTEKSQESGKALTKEEQAEGWRLLLSGKDLSGWRAYGADTLPEAWDITPAGELHMTASDGSERGAHNGGDILYDQKFGDFHLKLEWKISEGGNSGIFYRAQEEPTYNRIWKTGLEMQVLDNERHPDAKRGTTHQASALYDLYAAEPQTVKPAGQWNAVELIIQDSLVTHKLNGEAVVQFKLWTDQWRKDVSESKFMRFNENWAEVVAEGYIGLQDHGDEVWFRNIKIREL